MKVCMVTTSYPRHKGDFAGAFLSNICKELGNQGVDVTVVAPNDGHSERYERHGNVTIIRFNYFIRRLQKVAYGYGGIPENIRSNPWLVLILPLFLCTFFIKVLSIARKCDLIHVNWIPTGFMCTLVKLLLRKPLILTVRGRDVNLFQNNRKVFRFFSRVFFPHIDIFTTVSDRFADFLRNEGLVKPEKVFVIPNGISHLQISIKDLKEHKHGHDIPRDGLKAIYVGSLTKLKGVRWLVLAWNLVIKDFPDAKLLIIGDGEDREYLERMTREHYLVSNTAFHGYQQTHTVPYWLACADIFVLPSLFEGRPNVLLEAFQSELPVIATDIPGITELVEDGTNGFLVPGKDPQALADRILKLFSSERLRKELGRAGKESIRAKGLRWEDCAQRYHVLYQFCEDLNNLK